MKLTVGQLAVYLDQIDDQDMEVVVHMGWDFPLLDDEIDPCCLVAEDEDGPHFVLFPEYEDVAAVVNKDWFDKQVE